MGLLTPGVAADLRVFVQIRNRFAHHIEAKDCTDPEVRKLIGKLENVNETVRNSHSRPASDGSPERRLRLMIAATVGILHHLVENPYVEKNNGDA